MRQNIFYLLTLSFVVILSGCVVRTYPLTRDRVDQDLTAGNKGYLQGQSPEGAEEKARASTRTTQVVEVELGSLIRFERMPKRRIQEVSKNKEDQDIWGNRGYVTKNDLPEQQELPTAIVAPDTKKYVVKKGDTLQKISKSFYGTTKKWVKIYEANKDALKGPNSIYPGQAIEIPVIDYSAPSLGNAPEAKKSESPKETQENLK